MTHRDITIVATAAIAVTICFALIAGLYGDLQTSFAQEDIVEEIINETGAIVTPTEGETPTATESFLTQINGTIIAISGLMAVIASIVTGLIAWIRAKTGDRIISDGANEWLEDLFEKQRTLDNSVRDIFGQVLERSNEIDIVVDVAKRSSPEFAKAFDEYMPKLREKNLEVQAKINHWQEEADKIKFAVSPKTDPVKG